MTWGIPVEDPKTAAEAIARAKRLWQKLRAAPPNAATSHRQSKSKAQAEIQRIERQRLQNELNIARWDAYLRACEDKREADRRETERRIAEDEFLSQRFKFYMPPDASASRRSRLKPEAVYMRKIIQWVARRYGFTEADLIGNRLARKLVQARHLAIQIIGHSERLKCMSLPEIGRRFGGRDHTTILHALVKAPSYRAKRPVGGNAYWGRLREVEERARQHAEVGASNANA